MTDYTTKVEILCDLIISTINVPEWDNFKRANDLGLSLAVAEQGDLATIKSKGREYIESTYKMLLDVLDLSDEYTTLSEIFDAAIEKGAETA